MIETMRLSSSKSIEDSMCLFEAQESLFSIRPSRLSLRDACLPLPVGQQVVVNVWRNHGFEPLEPLVAPYFAFRGLSVDFRISGYDDSLSFAEHQASDVELLWLDSRRFLERLGFDEWLVWLEQRIRQLRELSSASVVIATWLEEGEHRRRLQAIVDAMPAVYFAEMSSICTAAGVPLLDDRSAALAGTPLSSSAQIILARTLACHWLAGVLLPPIKAIALDLDHTLHAGVLGEDGVQGVQLTDGHLVLQEFIKTLCERGIFIALVSRNERPDVEMLFAQREDYPLRWEDFSVAEVSWGDKASALKNIAKALRIDTDAILFVDDNPGELASVMQQLPRIHALHANVDATLTRRAIEHYPGLWRWRVDGDDAKRVQDLKANASREALAERISDPAEYFRSLQVALYFRQNPRSLLGRLADLCNKTNQFNLAIRRFNEAEIAERMERTDASVSCVRLSDRLSDSGVIAVLVAEREGSRLLVEELCVSCRAMGRQLEDSILLLALRQMPIFTDCEEVAFRVQHGQRNQPALKWLARLLKTQEAPSPGLHVIPADLLRGFVATDGISLIQENSHE